MTRPAEQMGLPLKERKRRLSNRERLFAALSDGAWHSGPALAEVAGLRFGARVHELRHREDDPREIETRFDDGVSWYRMRLKNWPPDVKAAANDNAPAGCADDRGVERATCEDCGGCEVAP